MGFERWTERARRVVVLAQETAREMKHNYIGTEHVLAGLAAEEEGIASRVLGSLGLTADAVKRDIGRDIGAGDEAFSGPIPFTPRSKKVFEMALREALSLGHNYIGTEHVLLGLIRENEGVGARILLEHDIDSEKVRNEVVRMLAGPRKAEPKKNVQPPEPDLTRLLTKSGEGLIVAFEMEAVIESIYECGEGLIGFRCTDDQMRYVAKDQVAFVEPFRG